MIVKSRPFRTLIFSHKSVVLSIFHVSNCTHFYNSTYLRGTICNQNETDASR